MASNHFKNRINFTCIIFATIFLISCEEAGMKRNEFGQFCNATIKCSRTSWLACHDGICQCAKVEEMLYNTIKGKCVSKAGERCKFEVQDNIFERVDCTDSATCGPEGICVCDKFYFEASSGTCSPQLGFGVDCSTDLSCRPDKYLRCVGGKCGCEPAISEIGLNGSCVGLAGKPCLEGLCTSNSSCDISGLFDKTGMTFCSCFKGFFQNQKGKCQVEKQYLDTCSEGYECDHDALLGCWNATCSCNPSTSKFSLGVKPSEPTIVTTSGNSKCAGLVTTSPGFIFSPNYPNSYPVDLDCIWVITADVNQIITLEFPSGYNMGNQDAVKIFKGNTTDNSFLINILIRYGASLRINSTGNEICVRFTSSRTYNGKPGFNISYMTNDVYKKENMQCVGLADKPCNKNRNCVKNAECSMSDICVCEESYAATSQGLCGLSHGKSCNEEEDRCSDSFICSEGKCACLHPFHQIYDGGDKCIGLASGPCTQDNHCISEASCELNNVTGLGFCQCKPGLVKNAVRKCELGHGSKCNHSMADVCDVMAGLKCRGGACACPDQSLEYSEKRRECLGLVHSSCFRTTNSNGSNGCVENAECVVERKGIPGVCKCKDGFQETKDRLCTVEMNIPFATEFPLPDN